MPCACLLYTSSTSQFISLLIFVAGVLVMVIASRQKPRAAVEAAGAGEATEENATVEEEATAEEEAAAEEGAEGLAAQEPEEEEPEAEEPKTKPEDNGETAEKDG